MILDRRRYLAVLIGGVQFALLVDENGDVMTDGSGNALAVRA